MEQQYFKKFKKTLEYQENFQKNLDSSMQILQQKTGRDFHTNIYSKNKFQRINTSTSIEKTENSHKTLKVSAKKVFKAKVPFLNKVFESNILQRSTKNLASSNHFFLREGIKRNASQILTQKSKKDFKFSRNKSEMLLDMKMNGLERKQIMIKTMSDSTDFSSKIYKTKDQKSYCDRHIVVGDSKFIQNMKKKFKYNKICQTNISDLENIKKKNDRNLQVNNQKSAEDIRLLLNSNNPNIFKNKLNFCQRNLSNLQKQQEGQLIIDENRPKTPEIKKAIYNNIGESKFNTPEKPQINVLKKIDENDQKTPEKRKTNIPKSYNKKITDPPLQEINLEETIFESFDLSQSDFKIFSNNKENFKEKPTVLNRKEFTQEKHNDFKKNCKGRIFENYDEWYNKTCKNKPLFKYFLTQYREV